MQKSFNHKDRRNEAISEVGVEVKEDEELMGTMRKAREGEETMSNERREEIQEREQRKIAAGARIVWKATHRAFTEEETNERSARVENYDK